MTTTGSIILVVLALVALGPPCAVSETWASDLLREAEAAYQRGDFPQAHDEFQEFLRLRPVDVAADVARFRLAQAALNVGDLSAALEDFQHIAQTPSPLAERASYFAGLSAYRAGDYGRADVVWSQTVRGAEDRHVASRAQFGRAWCAIRQTRWNSARQALDRMELLFPEEPLTARSEDLQRALAQAENLPSRSPTKAKWLSTFLPGSGQLYTGHTANGLVSTALNGALIATIAKAASDGRWLDVGFLYLLGGRFYFGGRQNAEKFARQYNRRVTDGFLEDLGRYEE